MKGIDFFNKLIDECKTVPESKLEKIIFYYKEQINIGKENGYSENEIIERFGNIDSLIAKIIANPDLFLKDKIVDNTSSHKDINDFERIIFSSKSTDSSTTNNLINNLKTTKKNNSNAINIILKIFIGILGFTILFPLTTTIIGFVLGFLALFVGILILCIFILFNINTLENFQMIPDFILDLPKESLTYFSIGSICFSLFIIIGTIFIGKIIFLNLKNFYIYAKQREVHNE